MALSTLCCVQGLAQLAIDLSRTHAANPNWTGHARFHVAWQSVTVALLMIVALGLIWENGPVQSASFYLAVVLACLSPLGFVAALLIRKRYGGTLSDPSGIPPVKVMIEGKPYLIDLNLAAVVFAFAAVIAIVAIYRA